MLTCQLPRSKRVFLVTDRQFNEAGKADFRAARKVEKQFAIKLRKIAGHIGEIVSSIYDGTLAGAIRIGRLMAEYSETLVPWAEAVTKLMHREIAARDKKQWMRYAKEMGVELRQEIDTAHTGQALRQLLAEQVTLIKSLPIEAAQRVHEMTLKGLSDGTRAKEIAAEIMRTGEVTKSRATLIARTEVSRTASILTQVRAEAIGSEGYFWRTAHDANVRPSHKNLEGKFIRWDEPPECDKGYHAHAGQIFNCFPGDVKIGLGNGIKSIYRSKFTGKVVDLCAGSLRMPATPNHPVLTSRGWVAAGEIRKGDYLVAPLNQAKLVVNADKNKRKPTFEQLFDAFASAKREHPTSVKFNFYGDIPDGNVDQITFDRPLSDNAIAEVAEGVSKFVLSDSDGGVIASVFSGSDEIVRPFDARSCDEIETFILGQTPHAYFVGGRAVPDLNTGLSQNPTNCRAIDAKPDGEGKFAFPKSISIDDIALGDVDAVPSTFAILGDRKPSLSEFDAENIGVNANGARGVLQQEAFGYQLLRVDDVRFRDFSGHVYTLETMTGWYGVSESMAIVRNCRCWMEPVIPKTA